MSFQTQGGLHVFDIGVLFNGNSPYKLSKHRGEIYKMTFCENDYAHHIVQIEVYNQIIDWV